jgi:hypothetical protein
LSHHLHAAARHLGAGLLVFSLLGLSGHGAGAATRPTEGTIVYDFLQGTATIGTSTLTISSPGGETVVSEKAELSGHGSVTAVSRFDEARDLRSFSGDYRSEGRTESVPITATFEKRVLTLRSPSGELKRTVVPGTERFFVLDGALMTDLVLAPWRFGDRAKTYVTFVAPSAVGEDEALVLHDEAAERPAGLSARAKCLVVANPVVAFVWYEPGEALAREIDIPSQGLRVRLRAE